MKKLLSGLMVFISLTAFASETYLIKKCDNRTEAFREDTLEINYYTNVATFNPNDQDMRLSCAQLTDVYVCANTFYTIKVGKEGKAVVQEGIDKTANFIEFDCK